MREKKRCCMLIEVIFLHIINLSPYWIASWVHIGSISPRSSGVEGRLEGSGKLHEGTGALRWKILGHGCNQVTWLQDSAGEGRFFFCYVLSGVYHSSVHTAGTQQTGLICEWVSLIQNAFLNQVMVELAFREWWARMAEKCLRMCVLFLAISLVDFQGAD